ncbi:hypothetical protein M9Y10_011692 [Tritrichomonas musculus]|uniref:Importin N-terminal domain-containing protein n=1 Tax=Tritrichomonas musculus TaxID=1915356 RepID=A0ABR2ILF3_9EUKA
MEHQIIELLYTIEKSTISPNEFVELRNQFQNDELRKSLYNIIILPNCDIHYRKIAIFFLKYSQIPISTQEITQFIPLLFDENLQEYISELFVLSTDDQYIQHGILPLIKNNILPDNPQENLLNAFIYCSYYLIKIRKIRNFEIIQFLLQIIEQYNDIRVEIKRLALKAVINQFLMVSPNDMETINSDLTIFFNFFIKIDVRANFGLLDYLLDFISCKVYFINDQIRDKFSEQLIKIFEELPNAPLDSDDLITSTILSYLIQIMSELGIVAPFEKLFQFLVYGEKQLQYLRTSVDFFFSVFLGSTDEHDDNDDYDNEEEFEVNLRTLNDTQSQIQIYMLNQSMDYINNVIKFLKTQINQSLPVNLAIFIFLNQMPTLEDFDISLICAFDDPILQYVLIDYSISKISQNRSLDNRFYDFFMQNYKNFAYASLKSHNPFLILATFDLIYNSPIEIIESDIYVYTLIASMKSVYPCFEYEDNKIEFLTCIANYLTEFDTLQNLNLVLNDDPNTRRFKSSSVFKLPDTTINLFKQNADSLFGEGLLEIFNDCKGNPEIVNEFTKIIQIFAGGDINRFICRNHNNNEFLVDLSVYSTFFPEIFQFFEKIIGNCLSNSSISHCVYQIFIAIFSNIQHNQMYLRYIELMYGHFINCNFDELVNIYGIELIPRIFIRYGKLEKIDDFCIKLCQANPLNLLKLIYEFSFILINPNNVYQEKKVKMLCSLLPNLLSKKTKFYSKSITCIFARVALHDKDKLVNYLGRNLEHFLKNVYKYYVDLFKNFSELEQRMIIVFHALFSDKPEIAQITIMLQRLMIENLYDVFTKPEEFHYQFSSLGLIKENTFYDDIEFLSHPLISSSITQLIQITKTEHLFESFLNTFPNL